MKKLFRSLGFLFALTIVMGALISCQGNTPNDTTPIVTSPVETTPAETAPIDTTPIDTTPVETTPAETTPIETTPIETTPIDTTSVDTTPVETTPVETTPVAPPREEIIDNVLKGWDGDFSEDILRDVIREYEDRCSPIVFAEGDPPRIVFSTGFTVTSCSVGRLSFVDDTDIEAELYGYIDTLPETEILNDTVTIYTDWWSTRSEFLTKYPIWSYLVMIKDESGTNHFYYFRVDQSSYVKHTTPEVPALPDMALEEGFSVVAEETLTLPVTEDGTKKNHTARVAALQNANGENALYLDVLNEDNTILSSITWKGYYQLFINSEGTLILMRLSASDTTQRGTALYQLYEVSDRKISGYDVITLEAPQINPVAGEGKSLNFSLERPSAEATYEQPFTDLMYGFRYTLENEMQAGREVYLLAECYLDPTSPTVYSDAQKAPLPNFEEESVADKYTWSYAKALCQ